MLIAHAITEEIQGGGSYQKLCFDVQIMHCRTRACNNHKYELSDNLPKRMYFQRGDKVLNFTTDLAPA